MRGDAPDTNTLDSKEILTYSEALHELHAAQKEAELVLERAMAFCDAASQASSMRSPSGEGAAVDVQM